MPPPTVPGMPCANSRPVSPRLRAKTAVLLSVSPAPASISPPPRPVSPSSASLVQTTTSRSPSSGASTLVPAPKTRGRMFFSDSSRSSAASSSADDGCAKTAAGPPMRNDVCLASGSSSSSLMPGRVCRISFESSFQLIINASGWTIFHLISYHKARKKQTAKCRTESTLCAANN